MQIKTSGTPISVTPRCNGGLTITQGKAYVLLSAEEWRQVSAIAHEILRDFSPSVATAPSKARIQRYTIKENE